MEKLFTDFLGMAEEKKAAVGKLKPREQYGNYLEHIKTSNLFLGISGLRGVGKTTILLQMNRELGGFYFSVEHLVAKGISLYDFIKFCVSQEIKTFFVDEVNVYPNWERELKLVKDDFDVQLVFSGSSTYALQRGMAELARRAKLVELKPLSFREYLNLAKGTDFSVVKLEEILDKKGRSEIIRKISPYAEYLEEYIRKGALPVGIAEPQWKDAYLSILWRIIHVDLASLRSIDINYVFSIYKLLLFVASSKPAEVSYSKLSKSLMRHISVVEHIVEDLRRTGVMLRVMPCAAGHALIRKEPKIFLNLPFRSALVENPDVDAQREEFFVSQVGEDICYLKEGEGRRSADYMIDGEIFEIGGLGKGKGQVREGGHLVVDGLVFDERIPIHLFGFVR